ncbi:MAG: PqiA protein [Gammaproteobacteria bacterium]|nr:MAG: PqiA protein [Gammaproteobacteria bacterium]
MTENKDKKLTCHECNLSLELPVLSVGQKAICPRCGYYLTVNHGRAFEQIAAFAIAALILLFLSLSFDFVSLHYQGQAHTISLLDTYFILVEQGYFILGFLLVLTVVILPLVVIAGLLYLTFFIEFDRYPAYGTQVAKVLLALLPWSMAEIFLIGVLVSLIKISTLANIGIGLSFYAYVLFSICFITTIQYIDKQALQDRLQCLMAKKSSDLNEKINEKINEKTNEKQEAIVNKDSVLQHQEQANRSIQKTWALLITSLFLYFPANLLPIMTTRSLGKEELNTILGGVMVLWQSGSYPIAIVIFIASIVVPIVKFIVLAWLNYSVQQGSQDFQLQRMQLYRITEFVGRWSMIDIFAVAILASLIQLGTAMTIRPGHAAIAFCGVVILTMLAANTFDSNLIWKKKNKI